MIPLLICLAVLAFLAVAFEEMIHINKAKSTLFFGTLAWIILFFWHQESEAIQHTFSENILDIASLWLFLFAAMTFVAYLNQHNLISNLVYRSLPKEMPQKILPFMVAGFAFAFSSFCDNITTSLVTFALLHSLNLTREQVIKLAIVAVFSINAGGAAMITGDVTTLMIFSAGKVGVSDLFIIVPAGLVSSMLLATTMIPGFSGRITMPAQQLSNSSFDKCVALILLLTILSTLVVNLFIYIPPLLIFMFGLSLVFLLANFMAHADEIPIMEYVRKIEFDTLLFFLGILLIVGMLREIGVLSVIPQLYDFTSPKLANYLLGMISALIDNVPLTAAVLKAELDMNLNEWLGLTFALGAGGSLLAIGSASGVLAMSKVEGLSFMAYLRYLPNIFFAFSVGYLLIVFL